GEGEVEIAGNAMLRIAIEEHFGQARGDALVESLAPLPEARCLGIHFPLGNGAGFAQTDAEWGRQGAGTETPLLTAAMNERLEAHPRLAAHIQCADALGTIDLVAGNGEQVDVHGIDIERDLAYGLRRVGMEEDALLAAQLADLGQRLD